MAGENIIKMKNDDNNYLQDLRLTFSGPLQHDAAPLSQGHDHKLHTGQSKKH